MFRKLKKCLTAIVSAAMLATCAGCTVGTSTANVISVDGYDLKAGVYIYYQNTALEEAKSLARQADANIDTTDEDALIETTIEGKKFLDYVNDKTMASCTEHIAVIKKFDELGLTLTEDEINLVNDYADSFFEEENNEYTKNGIGEESIKEILTNTYKATAVFNSLYGEGGSEGVQESQLKEYYIENNVRVKYVELDLHDADGNDLDEDGKKEIERLATTYLTKINGTSDEKAMLEKFNEVSEDYTEFVASKTTEAAGEEEAATTTTTTAAPSESETTTTTTTNPYENETVISAVTTDEDTKEEDLTYTPSKAVYDWAFDSTTKFNEPEIIEDEGKIYVAVKLDIEKRMTDDDLWSESAIENVRFIMFSDAMQEKLDEWVLELALKLNEDAVERYEPFNYKIEETQSTY